MFVLSALILFLAYPLQSFAAPQYRVAITSFPATLDPAKTTDTDSSTIILQLFDTLFLRNSFDEISPALVESYEVSQDRMVYNFKLKKNIFFHDGNKITSEDVVYSIGRSGKFGVLNDWRSEVIKGMNAFVTGKSKTVSGLKIVSENELSIHLIRPWPRFLQILADVRLSIVPKSFEPISSTKLVGSGPFKIKSVSRTEIVLTPFEKYWSTPNGIGSVQFRVVPNEASAKALLESHQLDNSHPFNFKPYPGDTSWTEYNYIHASVRFLGFNVEVAPFQKLETRKALVSVLPMDEIQQKLNVGKSFPISHFIPYGLPGYIAQPWTPPLPKEKATKILKGIKVTSPIELVTYLPDKNIHEACQQICAAWQSHGIKCKVITVSLNQYIERESKNQNGAFVAKLMPHVPDTYQILTYFRSDSKIKFFNFKDNAIDAALNESLQAVSAYDVTGFYERVNRLIYENNIAIPLMYMGGQKHYISKRFQMPPVDVCGPYFQRIHDIRVIGKGPEG